MSEWLAMGGYAIYVWSVFGVGTLTIAAISVLPVVLHNRVISEIAREDKDGVEENTASKA